MKNWIKIISLCLIFVGLISCGGPDPRTFNEKLMTNLNNVDKEYDTFYSALQHFSENNNQASISKKGKDAIEKMKQQINEINTYKIPEEGEAFKKSCVDYINSMINTVKEFTPEGELTKDQFANAVYKMQENEEKLNEANEKIIKEQKVFAQKRGFKFKN